MHLHYVKLIQGRAEDKDGRAEDKDGGVLKTP